MKQWLIDLDRILRGQVTTLPALRSGQMEVRFGGIIVVLVLLGMVYGFCMGWFALFNRPDERPEYMQLLASTVKVPLLFLLTLVVTFPSLYVFNALVGSRLSLPSVARLLLAAMAVLLAVLASFGPIVAFFSLTTESYPFILLFNVAVFAVSGVLGLSFLLQTLHRLTIGLHQEPPTRWQELRGDAALSGPPAGAADPRTSPPMAHPPGGPTARDAGALDALEGQVLSPHVKSVFRIWIVVFGIVGAQMGWVLRPFIGDPNLPFQWFRPRESNFFEAVWRTFQHLFSG